MHGEQHGVELGADLSAFILKQAKQFPYDRHAAPRKRQLPANRKCQRSTDHQHQQSRHQELNPNDLVIGRKNIFRDEALLMMTVGMIIYVAVCAERRRNSCHDNTLVTLEAASWLLNNSMKKLLCDFRSRICDAIFILRRL